MGELSKMPNIGKTLEEKLEKVGIETSSDLVVFGSKVSFERIHKVDDDACLSTLYALEGAIQGIRWHGLDIEKKEELKDFYKMHFKK